VPGGQKHPAIAPFSFFRLYLNRQLFLLPFKTPIFVPEFKTLLKRRT